MIKNFQLFNKSLKNKDMDALFFEASALYSSLVKNELADLHLSDSVYSPQLAVDELGLDTDLVNELVADYVAQIIKSLVQFEAKLYTLQNSKSKSEVLDYTPFRELAHKNLGVARNLRIKDAEILLHELMLKDDLDYLLTCLEALEVSTITLNVKQAYDTLKLIEVKERFKS